ncbi:MAG: glycosyltransferase family 9 protein, partial [Chloroflexi bacterium]|nr:glycosyltransferase family 9 protein [Chloroflexota bacterium]
MSRRLPRRPAGATIFGMMSLSRRSLRLTLLRLAARLPVTPSGQAAAEPQRVVLIRPDHLGDLLFLGPALRWLRHRLPNAHLTLLTGPWGRELAERLPGADEVLTCPFPWFDRAPKSGLLDPYRTLREQAAWLREQRFDTAIVLRFDHWWGAGLAQQAGIPRRIGYNVPEGRPFLTQAIPYLPGLHQVNQNARLLQLAFDGDHRPLTPSADPLELWLTPADRAAAERLLPNDGRPLIALHVGAGAPVKLWPPDRFTHLGNLLAARHDARLVLTGGTAETPLVEAVERGLNTPPARAVGRPLAMLAALLERCALAVGADSGVLHIAAAVGAPTVSLYGPVDAATFGPWGPPARQRVVTSGLACIPCNRLDYLPDDLPAHPCIRLIE